VERPDLHEDSSILADKLHHTLHSKILTLPDHVKIFLHIKIKSIS